MNIRIPGGLPQHLRFFHLTDPAITRKLLDRGERRQVAPSRLRSRRFEPLGRELRCTTSRRHGRLHRQGVVSHNCFARQTHTYLDLNAGRDFEGDRRQGERAGDAARGARAAELEARARRAGHEHRPVPVGRGALRADARDLGGAPRRRSQARSSPSRRSYSETSTTAELAERTRSERASRCRRSREAWRETEPHTPTRAPGSRRSRSSTKPACPPAC